jgi:hypothetical protein
VSSGPPSPSFPWRCRRGPYTASTFTYETSAGTTDLLAAGVVVSIGLAEDGAGGGDLDEDLLEGEDTFDDVTIRLVLSKTNP